MGILSLFRLSFRSSQNQSPPPSLSQITPPTLQLHHDLQSPSALFKSADTKLQHFLGLEVERQRHSSEQSISSYYPQVFDNIQLSSKVAKLNSKRKLRVSLASLRKRTRSPDSQSQLDASTSNALSEKVGSNASQTDSVISQFGVVPPQQQQANNRPEWWTGSLKSDKRSTRSKSNVFRRSEMSNLHRHHRASRPPPTIPSLHPPSLDLERSTDSCQNLPSEWRHWRCFEPIDPESSPRIGPIDLTTLSIIDLAILQTSADL